MAVVKAFRGWRYGQAGGPDLADVVVPPYDVISPAELQRMKQSNKYNFSHIILPEGDDKHKRAAELFRRWQDEKIFQRENKPALYFYRQKFRLKPQELFCQNVSGTEFTRTGIFCRVGLEDYSNKVILPHEKTFSGPKADRYQLMTEAQGNMEPVFLGYDSPRFSGDDFESLVGKRASAARFSDSAGVEHELWPIEAESVHIEVAKFLSDKKFYILDGHHRYETALQYFKDHRNDDRRESVGQVLANICAFRQTGTIILPTHRALSGLNDLGAAGIVETLSKSCRVVKGLSLAQCEEMMKMSNAPAFALKVSGENSYTGLQYQGDHGGLLDLEVLHMKILPALGIARGKSFEEHEISYFKDIVELEERVGGGEFQAGILVKPSTIDEVIATAEKFKVMPHKSTFFYPKIPSGLVVNIFD